MMSAQAPGAASRVAAAGLQDAAQDGRRQPKPVAMPVGGAAPESLHKAVPPAATRPPKRNNRSDRRRRARRAANGAEPNALPPHGAARSSS